VDADASFLEVAAGRPGNTTAMSKSDDGVLQMLTLRRTVSAPTSISQLIGNNGSNNAVRTAKVDIPRRSRMGEDAQRQDDIDGTGDESLVSQSFMLSPGLSSVQPVDVSAIPALMDTMSATAVQTPKTPITPASPFTALVPATHSRFEQEFDEIEEIGRGSFGAVFKVRNTLDSRTYAIKCITVPGVRPNVNDSDATVKDKTWENRLVRLLREVKALAELEHPHIVRYYQAWLENSFRSLKVRKSKHNDDDGSSFCIDWEGDAISTTRGDGDTSHGGEGTFFYFLQCIYFSPEHIFFIFSLHYIFCFPK
jgi:hypothetical protein